MILPVVRVVMGIRVNNRLDMARLIFISLLFITLNASAQTKLSAMDSNMVKLFFFDGLREKMNENYERANESFMKIIAMNPENAAVHYEIALLNFKQRNWAVSEMAVKKAISLDPKNGWYQRLLTELTKKRKDWPEMSN